MRISDWSSDVCSSDLFGFNDAVSSALLLTFARTETADVVRQLGWQNCLAYMNGAIKEDGYKANLTSIIDKAFAVLDKRASASPVMPAGSVQLLLPGAAQTDRKSTRLNSSH